MATKSKDTAAADQAAPETKAKKSAPKAADGGAARDAEFTGNVSTYADSDYNPEHVAAEARKGDVPAENAARAKTTKGEATAKRGDDTVAAALDADTSEDPEPGKVGDLIDKQKWVDRDGYPIGDHIGGTGPQDVAAQIIENQRGHGDTPVGPGAVLPGRTPNPTRLVEFAPQEGIVTGDRDPLRPEHATPNYAHEQARLVDSKGNSVNIKDVFEDAVPGGNIRRATKRVFIEQPMPGSKKTTRTLLVNENTRVPITRVAALTREWGSVGS